MYINEIFSVAGKSVDENEKLFVALPDDIKNIVNLMHTTPKRYDERKSFLRLFIPLNCCIKPAFLSSISCRRWQRISSPKILISSLIDPSSTALIDVESRERLVRQSKIF